MFLSSDEEEDDDGLGIWTHVRRVLFSPSERRPRQTLTARTGVASSLGCPSEAPGRNGRTELCLQQQKVTRHPAGCGFNPLKTHTENTQTHSLRGYRWSCSKKKQIMRQQEVLQPQSGLSQLWESREGGQQGGKENGATELCETVMFIRQEKISFRCFRKNYLT